MSEAVRFRCVSVAFSRRSGAGSRGAHHSFFASASCSGEKKDSGVVTSGTTIAGQTTGNHTTTGSASQPEGEKIAFISNRDANFEIYLMNLDGPGSPPGRRSVTDERAVSRASWRKTAHDPRRGRGGRMSSETRPPPAGRAMRKELTLGRDGRIKA
jgi:hypothetical protein